MFLQYLDHGVLITTEEFISRLLEDVPDDSKENVEIKYQIITRLPRVRVRTAYKKTLFSSFVVPLLLCI